MGTSGLPVLVWTTSAAEGAQWNGSAWSAIPAAPAGGTNGLAMDTSGSLYITRSVPAVNPANNQAYSQLHIMRYASSWSAVGAYPEGIDEIGRTPISAAVALDGIGRLYVAWSSSGALYIKTFNASTWTAVGTGSATGTGLSGVGQEVLAVDLQVTSAGLPVVAWIARVNTAGGLANVAYVKRWDGSAWGDYGGSGLGVGLGDARYISLAIDGNDPLVAYRRGGDVVAKRWNGTSWVNLLSGTTDQTPIATQTGARSPVIVIPRPNTAVVAFEQSYADGRTISALYLEDGAWRALGENGGALSTKIDTSVSFFGLAAAARADRACVAWRQGNPTSAYIACAKF